MLMPHVAISGLLGSTISFHIATYDTIKKMRVLISYTTFVWNISHS